MSDTIIDAIIAELKIELRRRHEVLVELRAELAAEKERAAGIAENFRESWPYGRLIAAAIRASNAAPPQTEGWLVRRDGEWMRAEGGYTADAAEAGVFHKAVAKAYEDGIEGITIYPENDPFVKSLQSELAMAREMVANRDARLRDLEEQLDEIAAPPHVEPSAAESDRTKQFCERILDCHPAALATEARMLELARKFNENTEGDRVWWGGELAVLVIETFGEKK